MTQENKDALYREEFEKIVKSRFRSMSLDRGTEDEDYSDIETFLVWKFYLAGRKKGEEELDKCKTECILDLSKTAKYEVDLKLEIESLKKELDGNVKTNRAVRDPHSDCMFAEIEYKKENESLKKEIEELRLKNKHNLSIDLSSYTELCRINSDYDKENQNLRSLVERAKPLLITMRGRFSENYDKLIEQWIKEDELILK